MSDLHQLTPNYARMIRIIDKMLTDLKRAMDQAPAKLKGRWQARIDEMLDERLHFMRLRESAAKIEAQSPS